MMDARWFSSGRPPLVSRRSLLAAACLAPFAPLAGRAAELVSFSDIAVAGGEGYTDKARKLAGKTVEMRGYREDEIENYLDSGEPDDKAGAYSIQGQGSGLIKSICGDYLAAVGLPLRGIAGYFESRGLSVANIDKLYTEKSFMNWRRFV